MRSVQRATLALLALAAVSACDDNTENDDALDASADASDAASDVQLDAPDDTVDAADAHDDADAPDAAGDVEGDDAGDASDAEDDTGGDADGSGEPVEFFDCDPIDPSLCTLPWPSSLYLVDDASTATGYRLQFGDESLPRSRSGRRMAPELFTHLDGYGLGVPVMVQFEDLSLDGLAQETSIERSIDESSPTILLRVGTDGSLERVPHWVELDATVETTLRTLFLRPAVILEPATRYIVAFRNLENTAGEPIAASPAFEALRDEAGGLAPEVAARQSRFEEVFAYLGETGVTRDETLVLAWDFVTASNDALHHRLDYATELAFAEIGESGAPLVIDDYWGYSRDGAEETEQDDEIAWELEVTMTSPSVVVSRGDSQGWRLNVDDSGEIALSDPMPVRVRVLVPHAAAEGEPAGALVYGHGLLGDEEEVRLDYLQRIAQSENLVLVSCPTLGMSAYEATAVLLTTFDMNNFVAISDGLIQGLMQTHVLSRSAITSLEPLLQTIDPDIEINGDRLFWWGGSQGGIFGATILATSPDIDRGGLAVPGINYSTMLQRSVNFELYFERLRDNFGPGATTAVLIAAAQLLWDSTDPVSYWHRLVGRAPFDDRPRQALLLVAKGDKQVAVVTNEVLARTFDEVAVMSGYDERVPWGLTETAYPHTGTGLILFDFGNAWPDGRANRPPLDELPDPHSRLGEVDAAEPLIHSFLESGEIIDICGGDGCNPE